MEMTHAALVSLLGPEFDEFLFASIGEDRNGKLLSVLSALARLGVDPWQEAATLARLPEATATEMLAALIAELPEAPSAILSPRAIAARLIALLPRGGGSKIPPFKTLLRVGASTNSIAVLFLIFVAVVLGALFVLGSRAPPAHVDNTHPSAASSTISPQTAPTRAEP